MNKEWKLNKDHFQACTGNVLLSLLDLLRAFKSMDVSEIDKMSVSTCDMEVRHLHIYIHIYHNF